LCANVFEKIVQPRHVTFSNIRLEFSALVGRTTHDIRVFSSSGKDHTRHRFVGSESC
jgi:hypothetical protein